MSSKSYCFWQNLLEDLHEALERDCQELSDDEQFAKEQAIGLMKMIVEWNE